MVQKCDVRKAGLTLGVIFVLCHFVWALLTLTLGTSFVSWVASMHFVSVSYPVMEFDLVTLLMGLILAFIDGFVIGTLFAYIYNRI